MNKKIGILTFILIFSFIHVFSLEVFSQETLRKKTEEKEIKIINVNDIKKLIAGKFAEINDYTADFEWVNGDAHYNGKIKYKKPSKILLEFQSPENQKIVSNGTVLYIYIPQLKVVIQQSLAESVESEILTTTTQGGMKRLFDEYYFSFYDVSTTEEFMGIPAYHLKLQQKSPKVGFKNMDIWVSTDGLILQSNGISTNGLKVSLTFKNIKINTELPDYIFEFEVPSDAQIIRNLIVPFSGGKESTQ